VFEFIKKLKKWDLSSEEKRKWLTWLCFFSNHLLPASESFLFAGVLFGSWEFFGWGLEKVLDNEGMVSVGGASLWEGVGPETKLLDRGWAS
jgi:hypothetical protein